MHRESRGAAGAEVGPRRGKVSLDLRAWHVPEPRVGARQSLRASQGFRRGLVCGPRDINPRPVPSPAPPPPAWREDAPQVLGRQERRPGGCGKLHHPRPAVQFGNLRSLPEISVVSVVFPNQALRTESPPSAFPPRTGKRSEEFRPGSRPFWGEGNPNVPSPDEAASCRLQVGPGPGSAVPASERPAAGWTAPARGQTPSHARWAAAEGRLWRVSIETPAEQSAAPLD